MKSKKLNIILLIMTIPCYVLLNDSSFVLSYHDNYFVITYRFIIILLIILFICFLLIKKFRNSKNGYNS